MNFIDVSTADRLAERAGSTFAAGVAHRLSRIRYQLGGGLIVAVVIPAILRGSLERFPDQIANYDNTLYGTIAALLLGYLFFRKVTALPGASATANILPAFLTSYMAIFAVFFALRLTYSRTQFLLSFSMIMVWFYTLTFLLARLRTAELGVVCPRIYKRLERLPGIRWHLVKSTDAAAKARSMPLVVDFNDPDLSDDWERYLAEEAIQGRRIFSDRQLMESLEGRVRINHLSENTFGHLAPDSIYSPAKRYVDAFFAALALVVLVPFLLLIGLAIRLESKGPAIFKQVRTGYRGNPFMLYKFRSMRMEDDIPSDKGRDMTKTDDDRITGIGHFIRQTRIDELPQIVNILLGQMSWIGPRPETIKLSQWYENEIPFYRYRHIVRPGITGWAQVKQGHVTSVDDVRRKLEYDFYYVKHFSLWTDVLIVIQTIKVMLTGFGAR